MVIGNFPTVDRGPWQDILGPDFFSRRPAMLGYHGDKAALAQLLASSMPQLAERMGTTGLAEAWQRIKRPQG
jgi:hypothetical protein